MPSKKISKSKEQERDDKFMRPFMEFRIRFAVQQELLPRPSDDPVKEAKKLKQELDRQIHVTLQQISKDSSSTLAQEKTHLFKKVMSDNSTQNDTVKRLKEVLERGPDQIQREEVKGRAELMHLAQADLDWLSRAAIELGAMKQQLLEGTDDGMGLVGADYTQAAEAMNEMQVGAEECSSQCETLSDWSDDNEPKTQAARKLI